ncbi:hypothetical protein WAB17_00420 [Parerythrobacter aurantius]|uniref:hypothetical protein n=1 Tax=Parerythrobacter aurantius TaxID=3127706 RepID=UPI003255513C
MERTGTEYHFVVRADELGALNHLPDDCPQPRASEWINRGTDRPLRPSSIDLLLRTMHNEIASESIVKLQREAGLRLQFANEAERRLFAAQMAQAHADLASMQKTHCAATFDSLRQARDAVAVLVTRQIPGEAISMLWRANLFLDPDINWHEGHSAASVAGATLAGGIAGTAFALALLLVPGIGPVAAAGALASSALGAVASFGGIAGATGGAIARMLTDQDVDGVAANFYEKQVERGKVVVWVNIAASNQAESTIRSVLRQHGGKLYLRS